MLFSGLDLKCYGGALKAKQPFMDTDRSAINTRIYSQRLDGKQATKGEEKYNKRTIIKSNLP